MANTYRNIFIRELTEILGERGANCKTCSGKTIRTADARFDDCRGGVETRDTHTDALRNATTYANFARKQDVYVKKAKDKPVTAYTIAISDWFCTPKVLLVNIDAWTGRPGQTIRIKARDNVQVASVSIVVRDADGKVLEAGEALPSKAGGVWWKYTTKARVTMAPYPCVEVTARDLAGNEDSFTLS